MWATTRQLDKKGNVITYDKCRFCGSDEEKHLGNGFCRGCKKEYWKWYNINIRPNRRNKEVFPLRVIGGVECHIRIPDFPFKVQIGRTFSLEYKKFEVIKFKDNNLYAKII